jgi:dTDP-4-amino-4,6-dideoxygalactose transaminase
MLSYGKHSISEEDVAAVSSVLRGDWLTTGPTVELFERALTEYSGARHATTTTSGTAALHVAYAAAGVKPGDEVITTPMTFVATASSAMVLGAKIVFADVEPDTGNIDPNCVAELVTSKTRAIAAVDYAGHPADMDSLRKIADRADAFLIEDAAHSIGSTYHGRKVGSLADFTTLSFFPTKNMTTAEGGAVLTMDRSLGQRAATFHNIGLVRASDQLRYRDEGPWHQEVHSLGLNYRLPDVLCALGLNQLKRLVKFKASRKEIFARYNRAFSELEGVRTPTCRENIDPMWHLYPLRVHASRRREMFERLRAAGIGVQVNYLPVYWHPLFEDMGYLRGMCPIAEKYYSEEISLPMFAGLSTSDQDRVISNIFEIIGD